MKVARCIGMVVTGITETGAPGATMPLNPTIFTSIGVLMPIIMAAVAIMAVVTIMATAGAMRAAIGTDSCC
jgi:uncharacterized membrane protein